MSRLKSLFHNFSKESGFKRKESCFERMIKDGNITVNKKCVGRVGGDNHTDFLSYDCMNCVHFDDELFRNEV